MVEVRFFEVKESWPNYPSSQDVSTPGGKLLKGEWFYEHCQGHERAYVLTSSQYITIICSL